MQKVVYAVAKQGLLKIHFPEVKAGQALISGIAIASANQELKPSVFPASGLKASELLSAVDRNWWLRTGVGRRQTKSFW